MLQKSWQASSQVQRDAANSLHSDEIQVTKSARGTSVSRAEFRIQDEAYLLSSLAYIIC